MGLWGAIKKSVNSNLNVPLNNLISNVQTTENTINTNVSTINTNTSRGAVKSIQNGTVVCTNQTSSTQVTISAVNASRSFFILNGAYRVYPEAGSISPYASLSSTTLDITRTLPSGGTGNDGVVSWQVIEFY